MISSSFEMSSFHSVFLAAAAVPTGASGGEGAADAALWREGRAGDGGGAGARHPRPPPPLQLPTRPPAAGGAQQVPRVEGSCPAQAGDWKKMFKMFFVWLKDRHSFRFFMEKDERKKISQHLRHSRVQQASPYPRPPPPHPPTHRLDSSKQKILQICLTRYYINLYSLDTI